MSDRIAVRVLVFLMPVVLGMSLLLYATSLHGVGVSRDSVSYLNAAKNLATTGALSTDFLPGEPRPFTHWPPLYPAILFPLLLLGGDIARQAVVLNAILLALYLIAIQLLVLRFTENSILVALLAGLYAAFVYDVQYIYARAWSETVFLVFLLFGTLSLTEYLAKPRWAWLLLASSFFALGWLSRYVGVVLPVAGASAVVLWSRRSFWWRVRDAVILGVIATAPVAVTVIRNYYNAGTAVNREITVHAAPPDWLREACSAIAMWLAPAGAPPLVKAIAVGIVAGIVVLDLSLVARGSTGQIERSSSSRTCHIGPAVILLIALVYVPAIGLSRTLVDSAIPADGRTWSPILSAVIVVTAYVGHEFSSNRRTRRAFAMVALVFVSMIIAFQLARSLKWSFVAHDTGLHYNTRAYKESAVIDAARRLPDNVQVYSNNPQLVYFLTERQIGSIGQQTCGPNCSSIESDLDAIGSTGSAILWVPAYDQAQCGVCLETTTLRFGYALTAEDEHFALYQLALDR